MIIKKGYVREIQQLGAKNHHCQEQIWFEDLDGGIIQLHGVRPNTPRNQLIEAYIEDYVLVHFNTLVMSVVEQSNKDIGFLYVLEPGQTATNQHRANAERMAGNFQNHLRRCSKGVWTVNVTPYVIEGYEGARDVIRADWNWLRSHSGNHLYYHGWGGSKSGLKGESYVNFWYSWTYTIGDLHTLMHEQGHAFGLRHANSDFGEYGGEGIMSYSGQSYNPPQQTVLRTIDEESVYEVEPNSSVQVFLIDGDSDPSARIPGTFKGAILRRNYSSPWMISIFNGKLLSNHADGHSFATTVSTPPVFPVELVDSDRGIYRVNIRWDQGRPPPSPQSMPEEPIPSQTHPLRSGLFYRQNTTAQGFDLWFSEQSTQGFWATSDDRGNPLWYEIRGVGGGNVRSVDLLQVGEIIGGGQLYSSESGRLTFRFWLNSGPRGVEDLEVLAWKETGSTLGEFADVSGAYFSSTIRAQAQSVSYVYDLLRERGPFGWIIRPHWYILQDGVISDVENGYPRILSRGSLRNRGNYQLQGTSLAYLNQTKQFNIVQQL